MKRFQCGGLSVFALYLIVLLVLALFVRDIPNQPESFSITLQQLIKTSQYADPGYSATAAIDIAKNGWISSGNDWIFNLWPPGFALLEALIISVLGLEAPVLLVLQVLASLLFSVVLVLLSVLLEMCVKRKFALVLPLLIFLFPVTRTFLLQPLAISFGESFAVGFFLIGMLLALCSVVRNRISYAIYAGLGLALSAYFRPQFEIILLALTVCAGGGLALQLFFTLKPSKPTIKMLVVVLLVAHVATVPWRIYHWVYQGSPSWVQTGNLVFENSVRTTEYLKNNYGGFVAEGGGNLVCRIDPATCGDTINAKHLFIKTFIEHPVEWYSLKLELFGKYWFSSVLDLSKAIVSPTQSDIFYNLLCLIAITASIVLSFSRKVRSHDLWGMLLWFNASIFSAYLLIFTVTHFEVRYFYFPKIYGVLMLILMLSLERRANKPKST